VQCFLSSRKFKYFSTSGLPPQESMVLKLNSANNVADLMEELGYGCTSDVEHCKEIFGMFPAVSEKDVAGLVGMIARTHKGLEDSHGTHGTFSTALCNGEHVSSDYLTTWNLDVVLETLKQLVSLSCIALLQNDLTFWVGYGAAPVEVSLVHMPARTPREC
jgi:CCR4-NOT transcription complex subunit 1